MADVAVLVGRILIALLFLAGFAQKVADPGPAMALLIERGLPAWPIWPAALFNLAAGLALVVGWQVPVFAAVLALYCAVTSVFHLVPEDPWQMSIFVKNWAIAGGCLCLSAYGAGRFSVTGLQRTGAPLGSGQAQTGEGNR